METIMTDTGSREQTGNNLFRLRGERKRVFLTQLPLSLIMVVAVLIAAVIYPQSFQQPLFVAALVMHVLLLIASLSVPWERFPPAAVLVIPYLDFIAVGLFRGGNQQFL